MQQRGQRQEELPVARRIPGTLSVGVFFGVPLRFHFTFILLFAFLVTISATGSQTWVGNTIFVAALFASVFLHEMGHALVSRRYGIRTLEIVMFPIGGLARLEKNPGVREEFWIAIAGPAVNFVIAAGLFVYLVFTGQWEALPKLSEATDFNMMERIALGNLALGVFNLLPALPMDGGRILRSLLARYRNETAATELAARIGTGMAVAMGLFGLVTFNIFLLFIAFFVYLGASQERVMAIGKSAMEGMPVSAAMVTEYQTLSHGDTLRDAATALLSSTQQDFPVMLGNRVIGLLGRDRLLRALAQDGPDAYISAHMDRNFLRVDPETDLAEAMPKVAASGSAAIVMRDDDLIGLLTMENLTEFILIRRMGIQPEPRFPTTTAR